MNEAETRAERIDPTLAAAGWGVVEGSRILREHRITDGRIQGGGKRMKPEIADYVLVYRDRKIAVIEAKAEDEGDTEGVTQAKAYAEKLQTMYTYSTNGKAIYQINMETGKEEYVERYPTPDELWNLTFSDWNAWKEKFSAVPFEVAGGIHDVRYYQENAINRALDAIAEEKQRVLLTLATGTGKTLIASQIAWKLFQTRWTLERNGERRPKILFLADRNILADQAFNSFSIFPEDSLVRISPGDIRKKGSVPTGGSVFFTIFQTFLSGPDETPYFGEYPPDFFDLVVIDECHRGGAKDESRWRGILEYFSPAVQIGLTATPKRKDNVDTYAYFGDPVYSYSLKQGINDGFLTPFRVRRIQTTLDDYVFTPDDEVLEGDVEEGRIYKEGDFNRIIEIKEREAKRVQVLLKEINQDEKTIIFCANQPHAALVRDLVNQYKTSSDPNYCVRVTANDAGRGEQFLREFQDNEKSIPTILTTSYKLSTGVDARNVRNIVLMRPVHSMIEFKQIIGRGTRLFDGKEYFTIIDFVDAYHLFFDQEWDGPADTVVEIGDGEINEPKVRKESKETTIIDSPPVPQKIKIRLRDGKEREIQHMASTSFWSADGRPVSIQEFMEKMFGDMPRFFKTEEELRSLWSDPLSRKVFLDKIAEVGYGKEELAELQRLVDAEDSDLFDVLAYILFLIPKETRVERVQQAKDEISAELDKEGKEFVDFVLEKYEQNGVEELEEEKLPILLGLKYHSSSDAVRVLGDVGKIRTMFFGFQKSLYSRRHSRV